MVKSNFITAVRSLLIAFLAGVVLSACSKDKVSGDLPADVCVDFATFVSTSDRGTVFTLRKSGDSPLITLTAAVKIDTSKLKPDTRVLIQYLPSGGQAPYESGPISLYGIGLITNGGIDSQPLTTIESWSVDPIKLTSMTRSGEYLDVWAQGDYNTKITRFSLTADETTLNDAYPRLYLVFEGDGVLGYPHQLYASFNLSDVWNRDTCRGVVISYFTPGGTRTLELNKTVSQ